MPCAARLPTPSRHLPGDLAMWLFILAELSVFALFFALYAVTRYRQPMLFATGQAQLPLLSALVNTLLLISGSASMAADQLRRGEHCLLATLACGALFVLIKGAEFADKFAAGLTLSSSDFWMFYLSLTFFHFLHVVLGMVIVAAVWFHARRGTYGAANQAGVETAAAYWHMVDLVWVVLFALVYVAR